MWNGFPVEDGKVCNKKFYKFWYNDEKKIYKIKIKIKKKKFFLNFKNGFHFYDVSKIDTKNETNSKFQAQTSTRSGIIQCQAINDQGFDDKSVSVIKFFILMRI